jgi:organic radical activating enzyme
MTAAPATPYDVVSCEYSILSEGCLSGLPAVFLRLNEPTPDAKQRHTAKECADMCLKELARQFQRVGSAPDDLYPAGGAWVVVVGNDPAKYELEALVAALQVAGFWVAVEISGTERGHIGAGFDWVTVRPYIGNGKFPPFDEEAISIADELKGVVSAEKDVERFQAFLERYLAKHDATVTIQPGHDGVRALCAQQSMAQGWRLSIPTEATP